MTLSFITRLYSSLYLQVSTGGAVEKYMNTHLDLLAATSQSVIGRLLHVYTRILGAKWGLGLKQSVSNYYLFFCCFIAFSSGRSENTPVNRTSLTVFLNYPVQSKSDTLSRWSIRLFKCFPVQTSRLLSVSSFRKQFVCFCSFWSNWTLKAD